MNRVVSSLWLELATLLIFLLAVVLVANVILRKRDDRAAIGWTGLILFSPLFGSIAYLLFGINRIRRRAARLHRPSLRNTASIPDSQLSLESHLGVQQSHLRYLARVTDSLGALPLEEGNRFEPLRNGDAAYPAMIRAIDAAEKSILLQTYIFRTDPVGEMFVDALHRAVLRGVDVRVLIDGVGVLYSMPSIRWRLRRRGIPYGLFMHSLWPWRMPYLNLRNHQKVLVADGRVGFTGGMNIGIENLINRRPAHPVRDLHFMVEGPIVSRMVEVFAYDWRFTTGETITGPAWYPDLHHAGNAIARGISGGPDQDADKLRSVLVAAIGEARRSVRIVTPYFLPDEVLATTLRIAARRGVEIDIVIPGQSNFRFVDWATSARLEELIEAGCRIWRTSPPFDHSKFMIVDGVWSLIGSVNWDPRSLRLNFEFNIECYDTNLALSLEEQAADMVETGVPVTIVSLNARSLPAKLRDGVVRLFSPYL